MGSRLAIVAFALWVGIGPASAAGKKNVLWIYLEDVSGWFSCYGDEVIKTPNIDALAASGIRLDRFYTPAGVCSTTRSSIDHRHDADLASARTTTAAAAQTSAAAADGRQLRQECACQEG